MKIKLQNLLLAVSFIAELVIAQQHPPGAYEPNVLGLPPVPQNKNAAAFAPGTPGAKPAAAPAPAGRDAISGEMSVQHGVQEGVGRIIYTTKALFETPERKTQALQAAKTVQAEFISKSCLKPCMPLKTEAPQVLSDGRLQFSIAIKPLYKHLDQGQYFAALQGMPVILTPEQLNLPKAMPVPTPAITVSTASSAQP